MEVTGQRTSTKYGRARRRRGEVAREGRQQEKSKRQKNCPDGEIRGEAALQTQGGRVEERGAWSVRMAGLNKTGAKATRGESPTRIGARTERGRAHPGEGA